MTSSRSLRLLLICCSLCLARAARAQQPTPLDDGQDPGFTSPQRYPLPPLTPWQLPPRRERRFPDRRWNLFVGGALVLGTSYLASVTFGGFLTGQGWFYVPVAGPLVWGIRGVEGGNAGAFLVGVLDGGVQVTGAILMAVGVWKGTWASRHAGKVAASVTLLPSVSPAFAGLQAAGRF